MKSRNFAGFSPLALLILFIPSSFSFGQTIPQPRILRLSFVEGHVTLQRPDVQGWAEAPVNTPIQQGFNLSTGENSFAEIQFENGGTVRLGEQSFVSIPQLAQAANGSKTEQFELRQGYATFHLISPQAQESIQVLTPEGKISASGDAEFRIDLDQGMERVEVFNGVVNVESNLGSKALQGDSVLVLQPGAPDSEQVSQEITEDDWDQWVANREAQVQSPAGGPSPSSYMDEPYGVPYGWDDLAQDGNWVELADEGYGWIPNTAAGWSPYSNGRWCWYPGLGYTWIGAESWGWLPYHYGSWDFVPGRGWVWFPDRIKTWAPARVTWYEGPGWVSWRPRGHHEDSLSNCSSAFPGGTMTTGAFSQGGYFSPHSMLGINPTGGVKVGAPNVDPLVAARLPGAPETFSAAPGHGAWSVSRSQIGPWAAAPSATPISTRRGTGPRSPGIVYDPTQRSYVNGQRSPRPLVQPAFPSEPGRPATLSPTAVNPVWNPDTAPVSQPQNSFEGQQQIIGMPTGGQVGTQPIQGAYASPAPGLVSSIHAPHPDGGSTHGGPGQPGVTHNGTPSGGQGGASHATPWAPAARSAGAHH